MQIAHNGNNIEYMRKINPDVIFMHSTGTDLNALRLNYHGFNIVYDHIKEKGDYDFATSVKLSTSYYMAVFIRKSLPDYQAIKDDMVEVAEFAETANSNENKGRMFRGMMKLEFLDFPNP